MEIFKLFGSIFVKSDDAEKSISKTDEKAQGMGKTLMNGVGKAAKWGAAVVSAGAIAATALVGVATNTADTMDNIDKMSEKIGISKEAYQEWSYVLGQNGMDVDKLQVGVKTLVSQMDAAAGGSKNAQSAFDALGLSIYDSNGKMKDQESMMEEAMVALANMENGTEKARLATELFGKAGSEMMPMLNLGAGEMENLKNQAHDLGLIMSDDAVKAGVTLGDTIDAIKQSFAAAGAQLGSALIPVVQTFADLILENMPMINQMISSLAPIVSNMLQSLLPPLMDLVQMIFPTLMDLMQTILPIVTQIIEAVLPIVVQLLQTLLPPMMEIVKALLPPLLQIITALLPVLQPLLDLLTPILTLVMALIQPLADLMSGALAPLIELLVELIVKALEPIIPLLTKVAEVMGNSLGVAFKAIGVVVEGFVTVLKGVLKFLSGDFKGGITDIFSGIQKIITGIWDGIVGIIKNSINFVIGGINAFIRGINNIKIPDWVPAIGGASFSIKEIPALAEGGTVERGGTVLVGERAPEFLDLPAGARVRPLDKNVNTGDNSVLIDKIDVLFALLEEYLPQLANMQVVMNNGVVAGQLAPSIDNELGKIYSGKGRYR